MQSQPLQERTTKEELEPVSLYCPLQEPPAPVAELLGGIAGVPDSSS